MSALRFVPPNGSLQEQTLKYLYQGGFDVDEPDRRGYCGRDREGRIEFVIRNRREIAPLVARGPFDAGITGLDLLFNSGCKDEVRQIARLCYAKKTDRPTRWVLATKKSTDYHHQMFAYTRRIGCELENLPKLILPSGLPASYEVVKLEGYEEMAIADGRCDMVLVVTETGKSLRECGLHTVPGCEKLLESFPTIIAKPDLPPEKEEALQEVRFALENVIGAATRRMMTFDLPRQSLAALHLPAEVAPSVEDLEGCPGWVAVEICIPRWQVPSIGLRVEKAGARAIVVQEVIGFSQGKKPDLLEVDCPMVFRGNSGETDPGTSRPWLPEPDSGRGYHH